MVTCNIKYDNLTEGIYYSGQTLSGAIELNNDKKRSIRGVTLKIEGYAKIKWNESEGSGKHRRTVHYTGRDDYINTFSYLLGGNHDSQIELSKGLHKFNFCCVLPPQLPTSLESKYGYIRYQIKVEIERPWKTDIKYCFAFTVIKNLDLNYENVSLRQPAKVESSKSFFLGIFSSQTLFMSAETAISGYVAGQPANVTVQINNESTVEVSEVALELKKIIHYNSDKPRIKTKKRYEIVSKKSFPGVAVKSKASVLTSLNIPAVPPTNIGTCRVLQVFYQLRITAVVKGLHRDLVVKIPITIGTVPLLMSQPNMFYPQLPAVDFSSLLAPQPSTSSSVYPQVQPSQAAPTAPMPTTPDEYRNMPPPSYAQAMLMTANDGDKDDEGLNDQPAFNPSYPLYNFNSQPSAPPPVAHPNPFPAAHSNPTPANPYPPPNNSNPPPYSPPMYQANNNNGGNDERMHYKS